MAQRTIVELTDDLDGKAIAEGQGETVTLGLDGQGYEIDLGKANAAKLRKALDPFVGAARTVGGRKQRGRPRAVDGRKAKAGRDYDIGALRAWAASNKIAVPARGRIPQEIVDKFKVAMG